MNVLVVYAHPVETSFVAAVHDVVVRTLQSRGHAVDDCDLNREGFDPVLSRQDRIDYHDTALNQSRVGPYAARLLATEALVFVHPVWTFGFPAILKGYVDRVFLPGVAFDINAAGTMTLRLRHIRKLAAVCTYGADRWRAFAAGDPPRKVMGRVIRPHVALTASYDYLACYDMNHTTPERRAAFLHRVERRFQGW